MSSDTSVYQAPTTRDTPPAFFQAPEDEYVRSFFIAHHDSVYGYRLRKEALERCSSQPVPLNIWLVSTET